MRQPWRRSELAAAQIGTNRYGYAYDTIGNRIWSCANAFTNSYSANSLNQYTSFLRDSVSPCELVYDADGNLVRDNRFAYTYDAENRMLSARPIAPSEGDLAVVNAYDHKHRRVMKRVERCDGDEWQTSETHAFTYDGCNIVLEQIAFADGTTRICEYFWGNDLAGTEQGAGGVGGLLYLTVDGAAYIPCYDNNGNITRYLDANGMTIAAYTYDAFGRTISQSGSLADVFRHRFSTKYFDIETEMYYYGYRFYHPVLMRWLNRDPIEEQGGKNLYQMVYNNPIVNVDSFGERVVVIKNVNPEMNWNMYEQAVTHFRIPSPYAIAIPTSKGRIRFELSDAPDVLVVNIYFRNADSSIWALPYEMAHVETAYALDAELQEFKRKVAAIEDCPRIAWEAYFDAWYIFDKARDACRRRNQYIDRKGGPHDL